LRVCAAALSFFQMTPNYFLVFRQTTGFYQCHIFYDISYKEEYNHLDFGYSYDP